MQIPTFRNVVHQRAAFTLVEVIVAVAILGTLLALLFPAVQMVRAAARANTCKANLHQIGVAIANFEQVKGAIPTWWMDERHGHQRASMVPLLPYLDQQTLWESIPEANGLVTAVLEVLLCPEDENAWLRPGQLSYAYNAGTSFLNPPPYDGNGLMTWWRWTPTGRGGITLREITDGLSNTAAMSERLQVNPDIDSRGPLTLELLQREPRRYLWYTTRRHTNVGEENLAAQACRTDATTPFPFISGPVSSFFRFVMSNHGYTHLLPPNHRGCYNAVDRYDSTDRALIPPSSNHAGGVHVLMCDGQVRFVSESIGDAPWRAAGTRAGGEADGL